MSDGTHGPSHRSEPSISWFLDRKKGLGLRCPLDAAVADTPRAITIAL
jgi:hypothetical protein